MKILIILFILKNTFSIYSVDLKILNKQKKDTQTFSLTLDFDYNKILIPKKNLNCSNFSCQTIEKSKLITYRGKKISVEKTLIYFQANFGKKKINSGLIIYLSSEIYFNIWGISKNSD